MTIISNVRLFIAAITKLTIVPVRGVFAFEITSMLVGR